MRLFIVLLTLLLLSVACTQAQPTATTTATTLPTPRPTFTPSASLTPTPSPTAHSKPTFTPAQATPSALTPIFDQILTRVSEIRGLDPLKTITPMFMTREQLTDTLEEDLEEDRGDILNSQELLKIMDMIPQNANLYQMLLSLLTEQVVGFYDTETEELYVIKGIDEVTPLDELTLAHEYVHALQQQHFDIHTLSQELENDSEADSALSALIEGDATMVQVEYMFTYLTSQERQEVFDSSEDSPVFDASPYVLQQSLLFPYDQGTTLVNTLLVSGEWEGVNNAFREAPVSTEQVLHPEKYLEGESPATVSLPEVATALGQGWEVKYDDVMGEFFLKTYLETRTRADLASRAAEGWGGDRFNLMAGPQGEQALVVLLAWDSKRDAQEFFDALDLLRQRSRRRLPGPQGRQGTMGPVRQQCHHGRDRIPVSGFLAACPRRLPRMSLRGPMKSGRGNLAAECTPPPDCFVSCRLLAMTAYRCITRIYPKMSFRAEARNLGGEAHPQTLRRPDSSGLLRVTARPYKQFRDDFKETTPWRPGLLILAHSANHTALDL